MREPTAIRKSFRTDINGLRAWAVVAVIFYHFGIPGFGGGFVGVDVFFVISGFLMTGIVIKGLEQGSFSVVDFYMARARRIIPALLFLCFLLVCLGYFFLPPPDFLTLATHTISSLGFFSNIKYWREAGYFDAASHDKWLLHTWSLSVEWQFYLILPLALLWVWHIKPGRATQIYTVLLGVVISMGLSVLITDSHPSFAFFLLPTRAWEMLGGGLVFLLGTARLNVSVQRSLETIGLALIISSIAYFDANSSWPGWRAVFPVLGAAMVLFSKRESRWTGHWVAQWLGDRSYSLYLWHWPIYVTLVYCEKQQDPLLISLAILLTATLGDCSARWIEVPSRRLLGKTNIFPAVGLFALLMAMAIIPCFLIIINNGIVGRLSTEIDVAAAESSNFNPRQYDCFLEKGHTSPSCIYGKGEVGALVIGDSHVMATVTSLALAASEKNISVMEWSHSGCVFVDKIKISPFGTLHKRGKDFQCSEFVDWVQSKLQTTQHSIPIVIIGRYAFSAFSFNENNYSINVPEIYFSNPYPIATRQFLKEFADQITDSVCQLAKSRTVYMMRPIPEMGLNVPKTLSRRKQLGSNEDLFITIEEYKKRNDWVFAAQDAAHARCGVKILDPIPYLCSDGRCYGSKDGRPLYFDDNHLSEFGNKLLVPMFREVFFKHI